jgi:hypothetical protein
LEIIWREPGKDSPNKRSAKTADPDLGRLAVDALFRDLFGGCEICPTCFQGVNKANQDIIRVIDDYWAVKSAELANPRSVRDRLNLVRLFVGHIGGQVRADKVDESWIKRLRRYLSETPYYHEDRNRKRFPNRAPKPRGPAQYRKPSTVEGAVSALHAALKWAEIKPQFDVLDMADLSEPPAFRLSIEQMADCFRYALASPRRQNLRNYLRLAVATMARPENILELNLDPDLKQWESQSQTLRLNPVGRGKTRKRRPTIPVPAVLGVWLDTLPKGAIFPTELSDNAWNAMGAALGWSQGKGEAGKKLIRRSMAQLVRDEIGEESWVQGQMMLGHIPVTVSDRYALRKPNHLGKALAAIESIIQDIEALTPGAFLDDGVGMIWQTARADKARAKLAQAAEAAM